MEEVVDRQVIKQFPPAQEGTGGRQITTDIASGTLLHTDQIIMDPSERIRSFIWEKFAVEDIRELEIRPIDEESADEESDDETPKTSTNNKKKRKTIDGLYDIISVVGAGAFGIVIACRDRSSNKKFALKITSEDHAQAAASLRREKAMLSQMSHPNIIKVYEMHKEYKNLVIMKMELGKESISSYLEKYQQRTGRAGLPEEHCAKIMRGLFRALAYLHEEQNVIHRDIKPDNIILGSHKDLSKVKLLDFGLAVQDSLDTITDFAKCGTFLYKPPEQVTNIFAYAKKADVWASGIIMFYLLTGKHPIWKEGMNKLQMEQVMKNFKEIQFPSNMSPQAQHLISCLCQKNQSARYRPVNALQHPWITRKLESELPLSDLDRRALAIKNQPIEDNLRKAMRVLMFCALSRRSGSGKHHQGHSPGHRQSNTGLLGGGGESSTTQEETQHNSTGSLLNGQQLENYKQMIKAFDIDGGVNLSNSSSHGNNQEDGDDDDCGDEDSDDNSKSGSCKSGHNPETKKSFKHHVFGGQNHRERAGDLTPKSHQKMRDHNLHVRTKRNTPKGKQPMSQMGDSEFIQSHHQAATSEKEEDYFTSSKRLQDDSRPFGSGIHSTTSKTRKHPGSLKKGKPPLNQKNSHTAVKSSNLQKLSQFAANSGVQSQVVTDSAIPQQQNSFTGALDVIFTRQKNQSTKHRAGSTQSNKSRKDGDADNSGAESRRTLSEKSYQSGKKEKGGGKISDSVRRLNFNSIGKESSANIQGGSHHHHNTVKKMSQSYSDKRLMTTGGGNGSDNNKQSKTSFKTQSMRESDTSSESGQNRYIIDGQNSRNNEKKNNAKHNSCSNNKYSNTNGGANTAHATNTLKHPIHNTETKGNKTSKANLHSHEPLNSFTDKAEMIKRRSKHHQNNHQGGGKNTHQTQRGSQMIEMRLSSSSKVDDRRANNHVNAIEDNSGLSFIQQQSSNQNVVGLGLIRDDQSSRQAQNQSHGGKGGFAALTEKYTIRATGGNGPKSSNKAEVANALKQREILSSAESTNHFITKTRVGGTLKNTRQVVAPIALTSKGVGNASSAVATAVAHHHQYNQADIQDIMLNGGGSQYTNPLYSASEEKGTQQQHYVKGNGGGGGGTALNNRKQSKMRREKFGQLKKQQPQKTQLLVENGAMQLPGITNNQSVKPQATALYSAKHSVFEENSSLAVQRQNSLVNQTSFNYPGPSSDQINALTGHPQKGLTPKRRQQIMTMGSQIKEGDSHKSSVSQLSPATVLYHNNDLAKSQPPRSTQVAGTAIIQGTKANSVVAAATVKQSASKNHRGKQQNGAASLFHMPDHMLEGILTSQNQNNSSVGDGLGVVVGHPPASSLIPGGNMYPGSSTLPSQADIDKMIRQRSSDESGSLNKSALVHHHHHQKQRQQTDDFRASAGEAADLNDRMIDSPKQRKYVPLLSKKLNKTGHGSSQNVISTDQSIAQGRAPSSNHYEQLSQQRQGSTNGRIQMVVNSPLDMSAVIQNNRNIGQLQGPSSISVSSAQKAAQQAALNKHHANDSVRHNHNYINNNGGTQSANTTIVQSAAAQKRGTSNNPGGKGHQNPARVQSGTNHNSNAIGFSSQTSTAGGYQK